MSDTASRPKGPVRRFFGALGRGFLTLVFIGIISGSIVASVMALYVFNSLEGSADIDLTNINLSNTSYIYVTDQETGEPKVVKELYSSQNREEVSYEELPQDVINVVVAAEDKRFWEHHGVDWLRTIKSTLTYFTGQSTQGGSTITQQVIKNFTGNDAITPERKVQEIFTALKLEREYSKEQILEAYLNLAYFGNRCYGIKSASEFYFNKTLDELNIAEIATIVATTNAPTKYNPLRGKTNDEWGTGMEENKKRREYILGEMLELGMIDQQEFEQWRDYDVQLADENVLDSKTDPEDISSWMIDQVMEDVITDLMAEYNYTKSYATQLIYSGGYNIFSTMDEAVQASLEASYANPATFPPVSNEEYPQTAAVVIAPDGSVKGMIGGNEKEGNRLYNRATMAQRHPGSTMKPISAYLQAFEMDMITWSTTFIDEPITIVENGQTREWPRNYYDGFKDFPVTTQYAIQQSINTVPAQLVQRMGPEVCWNFLHDKFQISTLSEMDKALSPMALGGMTYGMTPLELIGCYQIFVTGGKYVKPYTYTRVTDQDGNIVLEKDTTQIRIVSEETATVLNRLLQTVVTQGTGAAARLDSGMPVGGKTGSSTGTKTVNGQVVEINDPDLWFIGFTPYYIGGVWMGYDIPEQIHYVSYPTPKLWKSLMTPIHEGLEVTDFQYSDKVTQLKYCTESGDLATENCPNTAMGWYKDTFVPSNCTLHQFGSSSSSEEEDEEFQSAGGGTDDRRPVVRPKRDSNSSSSGTSTSGGSDSSNSFWDSFFGD